MRISDWSSDVCSSDLTLPRMTDSSAVWTEAESALYRDLSRYAVPQRERQVAIVVERVAGAAAVGDVLDICCGEGLLTAALLERLPDARVHAYDGSESMLAATRERARGSARLAPRLIDIAATAWERKRGGEGKEGAYRVG